MTSKRSRNVCTQQDLAVRIKFQSHTCEYCAIRKDFESQEPSPNNPQVTSHPELIFLRKTCLRKLGRSPLHAPHNEQPCMQQLVQDEMSFSSHPEFHLWRTLQVVSNNECLHESKTVLMGWCLAGPPLCACQKRLRAGSGERGPNLRLEFLLFLCVPWDLSDECFF